MSVPFPRKRARPWGGSMCPHTSTVPGAGTGPLAQALANALLDGIWLCPELSWFGDARKGRSGEAP